MFGLTFLLGFWFAVNRGDTECSLMLVQQTV